MMRQRAIRYILLMMCIISSAVRCHAASQTEETTRVLLLLDCSHSMWDTWQSASKIKVTQQVLLAFADSAHSSPTTEVALRVFGHLNRNQFGTRLEVPFGADNLYALQSKIKTLVPNGGYTVSAALTDALSDFPADEHARNLIIIITDGQAGRDGELADVVRQVQLSGTVVQTFVLGIGGGSFDGLAHTSSLEERAGRFFAVEREEDYAPMLMNIFRLSGKRVPAVVRLVNSDGELIEGHHALALYDHRTQVSLRSTLYGIGPDLRPDTLWLDPLMRYDLTLFTRPPLRIKSYQPQPDQPSDITFRADEGTLRIRFRGSRGSLTPPLMQAAVRNEGSSSRVGEQTVGQTQSYLAGRYDVEVLTLPPTLLRGVEVRSDAATELEVPMPGQLILTKPRGITVGLIFRIEDGQPQQVVELSPDRATERLMLQPGHYEVVLREQGSYRYAAAQSRRFEISSGQVTKVQF